MATVKTDWTLVRTQSILGMDIPDEDWLGNAESSSARAAGDFTALPGLHGEMQLFFAFTKNNGELVHPAAASVEYQILTVGPDTRVGAPDDDAAIYEWEPTRTVAANSIIDSIRRVVGDTTLVIRLIDVVSPPPAASTIYCIARVN